MADFATYDHDQRQKAVDFSRAQVGKGYCWLGSGPDCFDCSGLTQASWGKLDVYLPHQSGWQIQRIRGNWTHPETGKTYDRIGHVHPWSQEVRDGLQLGDLIFVYGDVNEPQSVGHVAQFSGWADNHRQIIAAVDPQHGVMETMLFWGGTPSGAGYIGH